MKNLFRVILVLLFTYTAANAYSYAASGAEISIDSREAITKALNEDNFKEVKKVFRANRKHYKYLNNSFIDTLYDGLDSAIFNQDKKEIIKFLELSYAAEILRRLDGASQNIEVFNITKVMLAKTNKFYKLLSVSLDKDTDTKLKKHLKACTVAIGNPGLFGVGARPANAKEFRKHEDIIIELLLSI